MATTPRYLTWTTHNPRNDKEVSKLLNEMSDDGFDLHRVVVLQQFDAPNSDYDRCVVQYIFKNSHVDSGR